MIFMRLLRWLLGYVEFEIRGGFAERFFNLCIQNGFGLWDFKRRSDLGERVFTARVRAKAYRWLRDPVHRTGVRIRLRKKAGLPFIMHRYRKRSGILIGAAIFFGILAILSQFVWSIEIKGNVSLTEQELLDALEKVGVYAGMLKSRLDIDKSELKMALEVEELSWIALNLHGTSLTVEVRERRLPPDMVPDNIPCNIYASQNAIIREMEVYAGWPKVKVGDTVAIGDLLVSGKEELPPVMVSSGAENVPQQKPRTTHARAKIIGETVRTTRIEVPFTQTIQTKTDEAKIYRKITLFNITIPLWFGEMDTQPAEVSEKTDRLRLFGVTLPLSIKTITRTPVQEETIYLTENEAKLSAEKMLEEFEKENLSIVTLVDKKIQPATMQDRYVIYAQYICEEEIGYEEQLSD